jgi:hypothetical protein
VRQNVKFRHTKYGTACTPPYSELKFAHTSMIIHGLPQIVSVVGDHWSQLDRRHSARVLLQLPQQTSVHIRDEKPPIQKKNLPQ